ncbi:MAG: FadR family transcriptional regulator, partial [Kiritimatiellae bacterium]|nr:FadR family transcriptional regulator [Kiritimatiellia bacterium]
VTSARNTSVTGANTLNPTSGYLSCTMGTSRPTFISIGAYIATLHEGDVLPGERELAGKLQISRNITREALQHFRTLGIIASKPKIGSVVVKLLPANPYAGYMPFIAASRHSLKELLELRFILESGCCDSAVIESHCPASLLRFLANRNKASGAAHVHFAHLLFSVRRDGDGPVELQRAVLRIRDAKLDIAVLQLAQINPDLRMFVGLHSIDRRHVTKWRQTPLSQSKDQGRNLTLVPHSAQFPHI